MSVSQLTGLLLGVGDHCQHVGYQRSWEGETKRFKNRLLVADFDVNQQTAVDHAVWLRTQHETRLTVSSVVQKLPLTECLSPTSIQSKDGVSCVSMSLDQESKRSNRSKPMRPNAYCSS